MGGIIPVKLFIRKDTRSACGSGVLIRLMNDNYDLVLTCAHCLKNIESVNNIEIRCDVSEDTMIEVVDFYPKEHTDNSCGELDIGMVIIKKTALIHESYIHLDCDEIIDDLVVSGYPEILNNENRLKAINLKGKFQNESLDYNSIVVELDKSINETASTSEKERVDGFSGAPVYYNKNGDDILLGLAKGVPNTKDDSVAFNRLFVVNIQSALEYLRSKGFIIYNIDRKNLKMNIKWIKAEQFRDYINKKILIIGGSGAGKSSFINTFSQNGKLIDSSGDGQTTRTNIEYKFSLSEPNPRIEFDFLSKNSFVNKKVETVKIELLEFAFWLVNKENYNLKQEIDIVIKMSMKKLKELEIDDRHNEEIRSSISKFIKEWDEINNNNTRTKREDIISLNLELIRLLKNVDEDFNNSMILTDSNKNKLKKILLMKKSFFDYREFDFLNSENIVISEEINSIFKELFLNISIEDLNFMYNNNKIECLYGKIYDLLIKEVKKDYEMSGLKSNIIINSSITNMKKISRVLKVVDGGSITALINRIVIYDNFSNDYSLLMDRLKLKEVTLIDTCGLDHIESGEVPEKIIDNLFTEYNFDIKTVFYIKKLDSGKPTELEKIIPTIYSVHSNAVVYCVFNGIDIFYKEIGKSILDWNYDKTGSEVPKAVKYIFNEGKTDILDALEQTRGGRVRAGRKETIYSTLSRNLVPYCSIKSKENDVRFYDNNMYYIGKIFKSIVLEEHLGLEVIPSLVFEYMKSNQNFRGSVRNFLYALFKDASIIDWTVSNYGHGHHKTKDSNIVRISNKDKGELGYWGTYNDRWNYVFNKAYNNMVSYESEKDSIFDQLLNILKEMSDFDNISGRIESAIIDYKDVFLGCKKYKYSIFIVDNSECKDCKMNCFRKILLKMYENEVYKYSIYEKPNIPDYIWLNEICDFKKGFHLIENEVTEYFIFELIEKLKSENIKKFNTVIEINPEIRKSYDRFLLEINRSFLYKDSVRDLSEDVFKHLSKN